MILTVIIPAYNCENTIEDCVKSVCKQPYDDIEVILINDGSSDGTLGKLRDLQSIYTNVVVENFVNNKGVSAARNMGIELAKGKYIAFLDSDDAWAKNFLDKDVVDTLKSERYDMLRFGIIAATSDFKYGLKHMVEDEELVIQESDYLIREVDSFAEYVYKAEVLKTGINFTDKIRLFEDRLFLYEALFSSKMLLCVNKVMYVCRIRNASASRSIKINSSGEEQAVAQRWKELSYRYPLYCDFCYSMSSNFAISSVYRELLEGGTVESAEKRLKDNGLYAVLEKSDYASGTHFVHDLEQLKDNYVEETRKFKKHLFLSNLFAPIVYNPFFRGLYYLLKGGERLNKYLY